MGGRISIFVCVSYCHTRPQRKNLSNPREMKDGPKSGCIFINLSYNQPYLCAIALLFWGSIFSNGHKLKTKLNKYFKWRRPKMEDDLIILKVEYLNNRLLDHTQILSLNLGDQSKVFIYFKRRQPSMEDDLKILKVEYLSNHLLNPTKISNSSLYDQIIIYKSFKWRWPPIEDNLKILKVKYLSDHCMDHDLWVLRRKL